MGFTVGCYRKEICCFETNRISTWHLIGQDFFLFLCNEWFGKFKKKKNHCGRWNTKLKFRRLIHNAKAFCWVLQKVSFSRFRLTEKLYIKLYENFDYAEYFLKNKSRKNDASNFLTGETFSESGNGNKILMKL